jgi:hypothetical protein
MSAIHGSRLRLLLIVTAALGAASVAGCGSTAANRGTSINATDVSALRFSRCMRANGVPNFPDPGPGDSKTRSGSDINLQPPAAQSAFDACQKYLPQSGHSPPVPASVRREEIALARCMRANGVPNFPDPNANGDIQFPVTSAIPKPPAFQRAQSGPCKKYLSNG